MAGIDGFTVLCLHADGTDAATSFPDSSWPRHTVTANGNAQVDTAQSVFGGASALFDGAGDYLSTLDSADFEFGSGDFTVDFRVRFASVAGSQVLIAKGHMSGTTAGANSWGCQYAPGNNRLEFRFSTDGSATTTRNFTWTASANTWYHVAFTKSGTTLRCFIDGVQVGTNQTLSGTIFDSSQALVIGINPNNLTGNPLNGWLDEIRISKGVARWTANFTPPTAAYDDVFTPTGGPTFASAVAANTRTVAYARTGGPAVTGSCTSSITRAYAVSGGPVASGTCASSITRSLSVSGGPVLAGGAIHTFTKVSTITDGPTLGGVASSALTVTSTLSGGVTLAGSALSTTTYTQTAAGGPALGGAATSAITAVYTPTGGVIWNGTGSGSRAPIMRSTRVATGRGGSRVVTGGGDGTRAATGDSGQTYSR